MKTVYLPKNLDLKFLLEQNPPSFEYQLEDFKYLIGTIVRLKSEIKNNTDNEEANFIPLYSRILQSRIHNYAQCLRYLIARGVVERDNYYVPLEKSYGYRLASHYMNIGYNEEKLTLTRLIKNKGKDIDRKKLLSRHYRHLTKWFNPNLQINAEGAESCLKELLDKEMKSGDKRAMEKFHLRMLSLKKFVNKDYTPSVDDNVKRFHSNLTNLKSELRKYITYDERTLCAIDIKNSQPFFSILLFSKSFYERSESSFNLFSLSNSLYDSLNVRVNKVKDLLPNIVKPIMLVKSHESECSNEFELYCTLVDKGRLYEYLNPIYFKSTGELFDLKNTSERGKFKKMFFYSLYADNRMHPSDENFMFRKVFKETFPNVYKVFSTIKSGDKSRLPVILQAIEAEIIVNRITRRIAKEKPELPIYTIHDSIVTVEEMQEYVYSVIKIEFLKSLGLEPSLDVQPWLVSDRKI